MKLLDSINKALHFSYVALLAIFLRGNLWIKAQPYNCTSYTPANGLSHQRINDIAVGRQKGDIWVSTRLGIDRITPIGIHSYFMQQQQPQQRSLVRLVKGTQRILAYYDTGKAIFTHNPYTDQFEPLLPLPTIGNDDIINNIRFDGHQHYWILTKSEVILIDTKGKVVARQKTPSRNFVSYPSPDHGIFVGTDDGIVKYNGNGRSVGTWLDGIHIQSMLPINQGKSLLVGTFENGLLTLDLATGKILSQELFTRNPIRTLTNAHDGTLLVGVDGEGIYKTNAQGTHPVLWMSADADRLTIRSNSIYALTIDNENSIWVGCYTGGVTQIAKNRNHFIQIQHEHRNAQSLIENHVNAICEDGQGNTWYATNNGISIHRVTGSWSHILQGKVFLTLCLDASGSIWAGGFGTGAYLLSADGIKKHLSSTQSDLTTDFIYSIVRDSHGEIWIGGLYGNLMCIGIDGTKTQFKVSQVNNISALADGRMLVATAAGLYFINKATKTVTLWKEASTVFGYAGFPDAAGNLWIGTDGHGLMCYQAATGRMTAWTKNDGMPSNCVYGILQDRQGRIWASTDHGLVYLESANDRKPTFVGYLENNFGEFCYHSFSKLNNGDFVYSSDNGVTRFHPETINELLAPCGLRIFHIFFDTDNSAKAQQRLAAINHLWIDQRQLKLRNNENSFRIVFAATTYIQQKLVVYSIKMEGLDKQWSTPSSSNEVRFAKVPWGRYTLKIRCLNKYNGSILAELSMPVSIAPPFWLSWPALLLYVGLLGALLLLGWRLYSNKLRRSRFEERLDFFTNTAHDIRTPVTLIAAPLKDLTNEPDISPRGRENLKLAMTNVERLQNMVTMLLDFRRTESAGFMPKLDVSDLRQIVADRCRAFEASMREKNIGFHIETSPEPVMMPYDNSLQVKIIDNLLSNALKYTNQGGTVSVILRTDKSHITLQVADTGIGIPEEDKKHIFSTFYRARNATNSNITGSGLGLLLVRQLVELHHGTISQESTEGVGTTFTIVYKAYKASKENRLAKIELAEDPKTVDNVSGQGRRLLLIEDNEELRRYLAGRFSDSYAVIHYPTAEQAVRELEHNNDIDIIISDVMLPGMQGDEFCRYVKQNILISHIPVLLLTAKVDKSSVLVGLDSGADDYLSKPFDIDILLSKINTIIKNRDRQKQYLLQATTLVSANSPGMTAPSVPAPDPMVGPTNTKDMEFLKRCRDCVLEHLSDPGFTTIELGMEMAMGKTLFYGKIKGLTGLSPKTFITTIRMQRAADMLKQGLSVAEVAYQSGFSDPKYFSTAFKHFYNISPSQYK